MTGTLKDNLSETEASQSTCMKFRSIPLRQLLWHEICSEYDARLLARHISRSRVELSREF